MSAEVKIQIQKSSPANMRAFTPALTGDARFTQEPELLDLSLEDRIALVKAILDPPVPSEASIESARLYKERFGL